MTKIVIDQFKGMYTNTDQFSADGAIIATNVDINLQNDITKSLGYLKIINTPLAGATKCLGACEFNGEIVAMIANATNAKLYKASIGTYPTWAASSWTLIDSVVTFDNEGKVTFVKYGDQRRDKNYLLFVNGLSKTLSSGTGGVFYWEGTTGASVIDIFGASNNPTGSTIEIHNDRIWAGNITAIGSGSLTNANHWVMVSKIFPESTDTAFNISAMTVGTRTLITTNTNTLAVGDRVFITSANNSAGTSKLNYQYHDITQIVSNTQFFIDTETTGLTDSTSGIVTLRGNTWSPSTAEYDDALDGAGIFRCDNNTNDPVQVLKSGFGVLTIFRLYSIYFFVGSLTTGEFTLARKMNLPYGCINKNVLLTEGGIWFVSQYGLSKVEGVTVRTIQTSLDNITSITTTEKIRNTYDEISDKRQLQLYLSGNKLIIHSPADNYQLVLDLINGEFVKKTFRQSEAFVQVSGYDFSIWKGTIYQLDSGYKVYNDTTLTTQESRYKTNVMDFGDSLSIKQLNQIYLLIEGTQSSSLAPLTMNMYYNGSAQLGKSIAVDVKLDSIKTWDYVTSSGSLPWNQVTTNGTLTWYEVSGDVLSMLQRRYYECGYFKEFQIEFLHSNSDDNFRIAKIVFDMELIEE